MLSSEQLEILLNCRKSAYAEVGDQIAQIDEAVKAGELSPEEASREKGYLDSSMAFHLYQEKLWDELGFIPERMTKLYFSAF